ncbi:hypothetical protein QA640_40220 [Bradyrhizobium sp. CB82]|uniref:hypothetical protein n=1 Tax=Bradyrhizobium sp. CB82 TaxID=3039159 RepID=UPI0024B04820|nr:hypothetical protein [Bradyrhizobium sp. CB82]WFU45381.1 hypothetical protein QA640_40220 [Bradyrhizobium sp. CB82]
MFVALADGFGFLQDRSIQPVREIRMQFVHPALVGQELIIGFPAVVEVVSCKNVDNVALQGTESKLVIDADALILGAIDQIRMSYRKSAF